MVFGNKRMQIMLNDEKKEVDSNVFEMFGFANKMYSFEKLFSRIHLYIAHSFIFAHILFKNTNTNISRTIHETKFFWVVFEMIV